MGRTRIFLAPCASERPQEHFSRTVEDGVPADVYKQYTSTELGESIGLWGVTEGLRATWEQVESGDYLLFYFGNEEYRYAAEVIGTEHNQELGLDVWPDFRDTSAGGEDTTDPWEYLIYLEDPLKVDIESAELHDWAGYGLRHAQRFMSLNDEGLDAIEREFGDVESYLREHKPTPDVWIEKTSQEGRDYKQSGELALGNALIAPSRDTGGRKRYETLREADVGDVVLHLLQEREEIVGASRIASELREDFEGPPDNRWTEEQREQGGYLRELAGYVELNDTVEIYDEVLGNEEYEERLHDIRENHDRKIIYNKRLALNQGHYFTQAPEDLVSIFTSESRDLAQKLEEFGIEISVTDTRLPQPVESYGTVTEAMDDIRDRLERVNTQNWIATELSKTVIEDWTGVLTNFDPDSVVTPEEEVRLRQIRQLYRANESRLREQAEELGSGTLNHITNAQTLFVAFLRDLQEEVGLGTNVNQVKIKILLNEEYEVETNDGTRDTVDEERSSHPLLSHLEELSDSSPVRKFTAPPEYWLTAVQYGTVSFEEDHADVWEAAEEGEIALLHSRSETSTESIENQPNGIVGVGILGQKSTKSEQWWSDETEDEQFPYLVTFERLYLTSEVGKLEVSTSVDEMSRDHLEQQLDVFTSGLLEYENVQSICKRTNGIGYPAQGAHGVFRLDDNSPDHERPQALLAELADRLTEVGTTNILAPFRGTVPPETLDGLYFPGDQKEEIVQQIEASLRTGKHIILTGPPGTGKTEIARKVCSHLAEEYPYLYSDFQLTTATADWSTFDTVGGYMPESDESENGELSFTQGIVLNRLKERKTGRQVNEPLVIDELNRADIDKAFGQLFTLLSGQSVQLPYTRDGEEIELLSSDSVERRPASHQYVVPGSWRIFATMNTYDKTSLYEMSYAFMRRFSFIRIGAPRLPDDRGELEDMMHRYAEVWGIESGERDRRELIDVGLVWKAMNQAVEDRAIGPAIVKDVLAYVGEGRNGSLEDRLTRAVISYIFPQLEGVPKRERIIRRIASVDRIDEEGLNEAATEMLQVSILGDE